MVNATRYQLTPEFDRRKSFYGKAVVIQAEDGRKVLQSYQTLVAAIDKDRKVHITGTYSATTMRHINEFLLQNGFQNMNRSKSGIEAYMRDQPADEKVFEGIQVS